MLRPQLYIPATLKLRIFRTKVNIEGGSDCHLLNLTYLTSLGSIRGCKSLIHQKVLSMALLHVKFGMHSIFTISPPPVRYCRKTWDRCEE